MTDSIIDEIKSAMTAKAISGPKLSELSGVSMQYVYRVLRHEQTPSIDVLAKLLTALDLRLQVVHGDDKSSR